MSIKLNLKQKFYKVDFKVESDFGITREYEGFILKRTSGRRIYLIAIKNGMRYREFYKMMNFEDDGTVTVGFDGDRIKLGTYTEEKAI